jgi:hypothetical protein
MCFLKETLNFKKGKGWMPYCCAVAASSVL